MRHMYFLSSFPRHTLLLSSTSMRERTCDRLDKVVGADGINSVDMRMLPLLSVHEKLLWITSEKVATAVLCGAIQCTLNTVAQ